MKIRQIITEVKLRIPTQENGRVKKMDFTTFVRKPFTVQAIEVTSENISEVAKYVGDLREKEDGTPYILVDPRLVPNVERVYPGFYMTKMGENVRCYSRKIFRDQFTEQNDEIKPWVEFMNGGAAPEQASVDVGSYERIIEEQTT